MNSAESRLDPSLFSPDELDRLAELVFEDERPALVGCKGVRIDLPEPIFQLLVRSVRMIQQGKAIVLMPEDEAFTTQAAANFLGMSRQFLVNLLEAGKIPYHRVGTHRRVYFKDLLAYQKQRDFERRQALERVFIEADKAGVYDVTLPAEDES
jgi:excisionase family DNA binding protein